MNKHSFLFPAFVLKYKGNEVNIIKSSGVDFEKRLKELSEILDVDLTKYNIVHNNFIEDELKNQLITYLISCLYSEILKSRFIFPNYVSGLSMGLYAALYCSESISFEDGAKLIKRIYESLKNQLSDNNYSMLAVTGLSFIDITDIIKKRDLDCEIVIKNNKHSYIITGESENIRRFYEIATTEGAIHQNIFTVSIPYHSKYIVPENINYEIFEGMQISKPSYPIISAISLSKLTAINDIKKEVIKNLCTPIDWYQTVNTLLSEGESSFIECGPGDSLKRISKFIEGDYTLYKISAVI